MWKVLVKDVDLGEPTSFLDHVYLCCTQRGCQTSKDIVDNCRNFFESQISAGATEKLPCSEKLCANISSWSYDVEGHAKKCVERYCELGNKTTQQLTKSQHHALTTTNSRKKKWDLSENCQRFAHKLFYACTWPALADLIFYGLWTNLLVLSLRGPEPVTHAWHVWSRTFITHVNSNNLFSCGKYSTTMQIRIISGLRFCRRSRRLKINIRWTPVHFRKSHVRGNKLDVQETNFSLTQFYRSWNNFSRFRFTIGIWLEKCFILLQTNSTTPRIKYEETRRVTPRQTITLKTKPRFTPSTTIWSERCWLRPVEREVFSIWCDAEKLRG